MVVVLIGPSCMTLMNFRGRLMRDLIGQGVDVYAISGDYDEYQFKQLVDIGVRPIHVPLERAGLNPFSDVRYFLKLYWALLKLRPDKIVAYTIKPVIYGSLCSILIGARAYALITGLGYAFTSGGGFKRRIVGMIASLYYRMALIVCERVFFQNPDDERLFVGKGLVAPAKCRIVNGSGVDLTYFAKQPMVEGMRFLMVARLLKDKGVLEYLEAAKRVKAVHPDVQFDLVGDFDPNPAGLSASDLDAYVQSGVVNYHGFQKDVRPFLGECQVFVLPSYREGTPRSVLEAMAIGRAVITTDAPGCRETVVDGVNGYLVQVADVDSLVNAMLVMSADRALVESMGQASYRYVCERYEVGRVNQYLIYEMGLHGD